MPPRLRNSRQKGTRNTSLPAAQSHHSPAAQREHVDQHEVNQESSDHQFYFLLETLQGMQQAQFEPAESLKVLRETQGQRPSRYMQIQILEPSKREDQPLGILSLVSKMPLFLNLLHYLILLPCWKEKRLANLANEDTLFKSHLTQLSYLASHTRRNMRLPHSLFMMGGKGMQLSMSTNFLILWVLLLEMFAQLLQKACKKAVSVKPSTTEKPKPEKKSVPQALTVSTNELVVGEKRKREE
ncbi:hypothetical protein SO802_023148 [Lithocarpus litseifolius]|uniref:Uncharacterized protein n=1 Tax=Lithocarpus litseifolius TaxID=425828 RepID=A0AAW2C8V2_9ROSI